MTETTSDNVFAIAGHHPFVLEGTSHVDQLSVGLCCLELPLTAFARRDLVELRSAFD